MMKSMIFVGMFVVYAFVAAGPIDPPASILRYDNENDGLGNYTYAFETTNGITGQEQANVINAADPEKVSTIIRGSYSYTGPDGILYSVNYVADENGFQPQGAHIPKAE